MQTKKCPHCGRELPASEFYEIKSRPDGLGSYCKECTKSIQKDYRALARVKKANEEHERKVQEEANRQQEIKSAVSINDNEKSMARTNTLPSLSDFQPRDIIKHLYNLGYRIEDNRLVCYVKQVVKIGDIINC